MSKICLIRGSLPGVLAAMFLALSAFSPGTVHAKIPFNYFIAKPIRGTISDAATGRPLAGASIDLKGGKQRTISDAQGGFSITVPDDNAVLVITYVGYITQEIQVGMVTSVTVSMQPSSSDLAQVVVVGYGSQNKRDVTGSVKSLRADAFNKGIINNPQHCCRVRLPG